MITNKWNKFVEVAEDCSDKPKQLLSLIKEMMRLPVNKSADDLYFKIDSLLKEMNRTDIKNFESIVSEEVKDGQRKK